MTAHESIFTEFLAPLSGTPGCCHPGEYRAVLEQLSGCAPCRLLVFGCGRDSAAWLAANRGGVTIFLEDSPEWAKRTRAALPEADIVIITVTARPERWRFNLLELQNGRADAELALVLPERVRAAAWDFVFVDGPLGELYGGPGRQSSLFEAARLAGPGSMICVHDTDRPLERLFCRELFDSLRPCRSVDRLRIYGPSLRLPQGE